LKPAAIMKAPAKISLAISIATVFPMVGPLLECSGV
jgi:hypothetical protein